jgi:hypothetical protein
LTIGFERIQRGPSPPAYSLKRCVGYLICELPSNFRDFTWTKFSDHNLLSLVLKDQKLFLSLAGRVPLTGGNVPQETTVCSSKGEALQFTYGLEFLSIQA